MKRTVIIFLASIIVVAVGIGSYKFIKNRSNARGIDDRQEVYFANNPVNLSSSAGSTDFVPAAAAVTPAVVHIQTVYRGEAGGSDDLLEELFGMPGRSAPSMGSGSGVLIAPDGYIVTNNHVIQDASAVEVILPDKRRFKAELVGRDPATDLALIKVKGNNLPVVKLGNSDNVQVGEWVLAVGYPFSLNTTVTAGIISAKGRSIGILDQPAQNSDGAQTASAVESFLQTDAAINPGNSGGALVNTRGELVGINAAIASQTGSYAGYGFAIPVNLARKVVDDLMKFGEVKRGFLGVTFPSPEAEDQLLREKGIKPGSVNGVYITGVQKGSAAAEAGLAAGDIIQSVDGNQIASSSEFSERIARHRPGDKVQMSYLRNGKSQNVTVTLKGPESLNLASGNVPGQELHSKLGAAFAPVSKSAKQRLGISSGVVVTSVTEGGFFDQVGIPKGTIIIRMNGRFVNSSADVDTALRSAKSGMVRVEGITPDGTRIMFNFSVGA